eukprot:g5889.t1
MDCRLKEMESKLELLEKKFGTKCTSLTSREAEFTVEREEKLLLESMYTENGPVCIPRFYFGSRNKSNTSVTINKSDKNDSSKDNKENISFHDDPYTALCKHAHESYIHRLSAELLTDEELSALADLVSISFEKPESRRINFETLRDIGETWREKYVNQIRQNSKSLLSFFTATTFCKFRRNKRGEVNASLFLRYVDQESELQQLKLELSRYDEGGKGYLKEVEMDRYIQYLTFYLPALEKLGEDFRRFYVCTVVRKFFFFLDPRNSKRVRISDILGSASISDLLALRSCSQLSRRRAKRCQEEKESNEDNFENEDDDAFQDALERMGLDAQNWFSPENVRSVYGQYLRLDVDKNGMLSMHEMMAWPSCDSPRSLTSVFVRRIFQEYLTYAGEMDYKTFLDFKLAMDMKQHARSLRYFWRVLDLKKQGFIGHFEINFFFREVVELLEKGQRAAHIASLQESYDQAVQANDAEDAESTLEILNSLKNKTESLDEENDNPSVADVTDEIFDMVQPRHSTRITFNDLLACGLGDKVVSMLTDVVAFWNYDNRENLLIHADEENQETEKGIEKEDI